ncbi:hypothetical protein [uncultured Chitinophaga sp.]|nr:hypothetical protein [uncultured Chitinophaga sp.]
MKTILFILKTAGSRLDIPGKNGVTPLQHAKKSGYTAIVKILEER